MSLPDDVAQNVLRHCLAHPNFRMRYSYAQRPGAAPDEDLLRDLLRRTEGPAGAKGGWAACTTVPFQFLPPWVPPGFTRWDACSPLPCLNANLTNHTN